jgi:hypothetical protein
VYWEFGFRVIGFLSGKTGKLISASAAVQCREIITTVAISTAKGVIVRYIEVTVILQNAKLCSPIDISRRDHKAVSRYSDGRRP